MSDSDSATFLEGLRSHTGRQGRPQRARDPVNQAMIRHWCDAMGDENPVYTDPDFAGKSIHGEVVAPSTMLNVWTLPGNVPRTPDGADPMASLLARLDEAGYTSVVATDTEQDYARYLRLGEHLTAIQSVSDVSGEKQTALGRGHFVTTTTEYRNQHGETVGRMRFRLLKFKPGTGRRSSGDEEGAGDTPRPLRPRPGISHDTRFFWEGVEAGELRIQRCAACDKLYHPPVVRCAACGRYDLGYVVSGGKGVVYSFVEPRHPKLPAFDSPPVVGLVELEEGTRLVTNLVDVAPEQVEIGMPVEVVFRKPDAGLTLPMFRPRRPPRRETTLRFEEVATGAALAPCPIPVTATLIVAGALASRDYQDVHHDRDLAVARGARDIFMNIMTTSGLCGRYLADWAGPEARLRSLRIRLGVPSYPHDTMTLSGSVLSARRGTDGGLVEIGLVGTNRLGDHVRGAAVVELPDRPAGR